MKKQHNHGIPMFGAHEMVEHEQLYSFLPLECLYNPCTAFLHCSFVMRCTCDANHYRERIFSIECFWLVSDTQSVLLLHPHQRANLMLLHRLRMILFQLRGNVSPASSVDVANIMKSSMTFYHCLWKPATFSPIKQQFCGSS